MRHLWTLNHFEVLNELNRPLNDLSIDRYCTHQLQLHFALISSYLSIKIHLQTWTVATDGVWRVFTDDNCTKLLWRKANKLLFNLYNKLALSPYGIITEKSIGQRAARFMCIENAIDSPSECGRRKTCFVRKKISAIIFLSSQLDVSQLLMFLSPLWLFIINALTV